MANIGKMLHARKPSCKFPGCQQPVHIEKSGKIHDFCSQKHAQQFSIAPKSTVQTSITNHPSSQQSFPSDTPMQVVFPRDVVIISESIGEEETKFMKNMGLRLITTRHVEETAQLWGKRLLLIIADQLSNNLAKFCSHYEQNNNPVAGTIMYMLKKEATIPRLKHMYKRNVEMIHFYERNEPFYMFTNFYDCSFVDKGITWATSEHYFQAHKFEDQSLFQHIAKTRAPRDAFEEAQKHAQYVRSDWRQGKSLEVMKKAVLLKFKQNQIIQNILLDTGNAKLIEHTVNDNYWGDGGGTGENHLGIILEKVREELRNKDVTVPEHQLSPLSVSYDANSLDQYYVNTLETIRDLTQKGLNGSMDKQYCTQKIAQVLELFTSKSPKF